MNHPAYPSHFDLDRERDARERDEDNLESLWAARKAVSDALVALAGLDDITHPDAPWAISDVVAGLDDALVGLDSSIDVIANGPLVLADA